MPVLRGGQQARGAVEQGLAPVTERLRLSQQGAVLQHLRFRRPGPTSTAPATPLAARSGQLCCRDIQTCFFGTCCNLNQQCVNKCCVGGEICVSGTCCPTNQVRRGGVILTDEWPLHCPA